MSVPTPGWLAMHLAPYGTPMALSLLGVAATLADGKASDEEIDAWYDELARTDDTVFVLNQHYVALEQAYPYLQGYLGALTGWTENPAYEHWAQLQRAAGHLRGIAWSQTEPKQQGDLLGTVYNQMLSIGAGRTKVFDFTTPQEAVEDMLSDPRLLATVLRSESFTDLWCGSGTRVIAFHDVRLIFGLPVYLPYRLNDPSEIAIAMAGLNAVSHDFGPDVTLSCDRGWAEAWGTSSFYGRAPSLRRRIPPEVRAGIPEIDPRPL